MTKVLVVDDEAPIRLLCRVNLEAEGLQVVEAADGQAGLEAARAELPDVILLDVMMPGMDGWQVAERLFEDKATSEIPLVFLTARAELRDRARGLELGGVEYITKPFNPVELASVVEKLLDRVRRGERDDLRQEKITELRRLLVEYESLGPGEVGRGDRRPREAAEASDGQADTDSPEAAAQ